MGALQKNSILAKFHPNPCNLWPVYSIHTNSLFWVIFEELTFCHFPLPNTSICGRDSSELIFHFNILDFQANRKQPTLSQSSHISAMGYLTTIHRSGGG